MRRSLRGRIFAAIERGDDAKALHFATPNVLFKSVGEFGQSPLVAAISAGRGNLALEFISRGGFYAGDGSLAHAAMQGNLDVVDALLMAGKHPDEPLRERDFNAGYTPLMWAVNRRHLQIVRRLLMAGANVNAVAEDGSTAVMMTANAAPESLEALEMLCAYGPDIHKKDWRGRSVVREARDREKNAGKPQMREILERHFPGTDFEAA
ncbi:ankyrin repeat domain-containing protein [Variovorax sp. MHTC-1]|uniref:ankyrin repeat domain-containing protein n=1 Tax=Variovorax sp. MHTC-1 TaxID=2495593 RepID=UPI00163C41DA|nr:ankyrin repeat domain-containing protein [Variovorax sp. MHTC-1]